MNLLNYSYTRYAMVIQACKSLLMMVDMAWGMMSSLPGEVIRSYPWFIHDRRRNWAAIPLDGTTSITIGWPECAGKMSNYDIDQRGVPVLEADDIELKAEEVLAHFNPQMLTQPRRIPLVELVHNLHEKYQLGFDVAQELGFATNGDKILGKTVLKPLGLFIDTSLVGDARFPYVLGHELGHVVLHRKIQLERTGYSEQGLTDTEFDLVTGKKVLRTPRDWIEWQAKRFSSAILMPRVAVRSVVIMTQQELKISRNVGSIILENIPYSLRDYEAVKNRIIRVFGVTATNAEIRLKDLKILNDRRTLDARHVSELFLSE